MQVRERIARTQCEPEEKIMLSHVADVLARGQSRNIPVNTDFLSPREQALVQQVLPLDAYLFWGGWFMAERNICAYLPDYLDKSWFVGDEAPVVVLRATFSSRETLFHRDFLGAIMGSGIQRNAIGDILVSDHSCDFFVNRAVSTYLKQNLLSAGRVRLSVSEISISEVMIPEQKVKRMETTVASLRLDAVCASAFCLSREKAAQAIRMGRVTLNSRPCEKPDKPICTADVVALRGQGKATLEEVSGTTKKGRIAIAICRYV